jgi:hypothetical protein
MDHHHHHHQGGGANANPLLPGSEDMSPLEQEVLDEYERLAENMKKVGDPSHITYTKDLLVYFL